MNAAHIHLIINHFPIAGILFAMPLLLIAYWKESDTLARAGLFAILITGLITIPTYLTGEPAEEIIEHLPGISEKLIKIHEETAEKAIWFVGAASLASLICLIIAYKKKSMPRWGLFQVMILSVCAMGFLAWTNNLGGEISHPEIRKDKAITSPASGESNDKDDKD